MRSANSDVIDEAKSGRCVLLAVVSRWSDCYKGSFARIVRSTRKRLRSTCGRHARVNCFAHGSDGPLNCVNGTRADCTRVTIATGMHV